MRIILTILATIIITPNCVAQKEKAILDGQSFTIDIVEKNKIGKDDKMSDVISFKAGKVYTKFSRNNGYPDAEYTTTSKDGMITLIISFKGQTKGKKHLMNWEGIVNGEEIEGTAIVKKKGAIRTIYEFKGTQK